MANYPNKFNYGDKVLDAAANNNDSINITSNINGNTIKFKPLIKTFNDTQNVSFSSESVFGRMDDLHSYQNTKRSMNINFDVPSYSQEEANDNFIKAAFLKTWLYPGYAGTSAITISKAPLFRIRYMNLIYNKNNINGLLGIIDGFSFAPDLGEGAYVSNGKVIPKTFNINLNFKVIHEFKLQNSLSSRDYPYLIDSGSYNKLINPTEEAISGNGVRTTR
jgi:hypothetical protein